MAWEAFPRVHSGASSASTAASTVASLAVSRCDEPRVLKTEVVLEPSKATGYSPKQSVHKAANFPGLRIASLGSYCGVRQSIKKVGMDAESLPFDWMRTRLEGILHYLRNDFEGFFDFVTTQEVPGSGFPCAGIPPMVMYRDWMHSFWHDDPTDAGEQEKYRRRFDRFKNLANSCTPEGKMILFVRSAATVDEISKTDELLQELIHRFGPTVKLLLIVDNQYRTTGPVLVQDRDNLLVYFLESSHFNGTDAPYGIPLECAIGWALGKEIEAKVVPSVPVLSSLVSPFLPCTMGGLEAFEPLPTRERPAQSPIPGRSRRPLLPRALPFGVPPAPGSAQQMSAPTPPLMHHPGVGLTSAAAGYPPCYTGRGAGRLGAFVVPRYDQPHPHPWRPAAMPRTLQPLYEQQPQSYVPMVVQSPTPAGNFGYPDGVTFAGVTETVAAPAGQQALQGIATQSVAAEAARQQQQQQQQQLHQVQVQRQQPPKSWVPQMRMQSVP